MPLAALLVPPALLAAAAALGWGLWRGGLDAGRPAAAIASWLAALVVAGAWFAGRRTPFEVATPITAGVAPLALRMDAVVVVFQLVVLTGAALLLTFQRRSAPEAAAAALAVAVAVATLAAGSVVLSAFGLASCA